MAACFSWPFEASGLPDRPAFQLTGFANTGVKAVGRIELTIERGQLRLGLIEMADVMLCRILRAARLQNRQHLRFQGMDIHPFFNDVVLMEDMAEKMAVIQLMTE